MTKRKPVDMGRYMHVREFANMKHINYYTLMMRIRNGIYTDTIHDNGLVYISKDYLYLSDSIIQERRKHTANAPEGMISGPDIAKILGLSVSRISRLISSGALGEVVRIWKTPFVDIKIAMAYVKKYLENKENKERNNNK